MLVMSAPRLFALIPNHAATCQSVADLLSRITSVTFSPTRPPITMKRKNRAYAMLAKCSNSSCTASFRFLHSGRLFHFEKRLPATCEGATERRVSTRVELFWLCEECAAEFTLLLDAALGARVVPLARRAFRAA